ncbi:hypothetical protein BpHYR1_010556 [Brachionus plicatilis]|uniref:Uncharacterized protein n=1 Tax=Brachionus plicatilis TaxID=10195 RepID=A0A3M7T8K8_BRAPC|nr:hypothetical protein BpHYR1_010556 [Brachionus plicatilis]
MLPNLGSKTFFDIFSDKMILFFEKRDQPVLISDSKNDFYELFYGWHWFLLFVNFSIFIIKFWYLERSGRPANGNFGVPTRPTLLDGRTGRCLVAASFALLFVPSIHNFKIKFLNEFQINYM